MADQSHDRELMDGMPNAIRQFAAHVGINARRARDAVADVVDLDSDGNVHMLDELKTKAIVGNSFKKEIVLPFYVKNVSG